MTTILTDMSSQDDLAGAVEANMEEQFAYFGRSPRANVDDSPELVRFLSGIPIAEYNGVIRARLAPEFATDGVQSRIQAVVASFAALRQPFFWWVGPTSSPADLGGHLTAAGLTRLGDGPGMAADLHALDERGERPPGLSIVSVTDERALRDWVEVAGAGYGEPASIRQARYDVHMDLGLGADLALQRYVAYVGGRPVAHVRAVPGHWRLHPARLPSGMLALTLCLGAADLTSVLPAARGKRADIISSLATANTL
jgi:hypothetical protein